MYKVSSRRAKEIKNEINSLLEERAIFMKKSYSKLSKKERERLTTIVETIDSLYDELYD